MTRLSVNINKIALLRNSRGANIPDVIQFAKDVELMQLKTGVMDGSAMDAQRIQFLATLPSKDVLRAQLLGVFNAPGSKLARTLIEAQSSLARVLAARKE